MTNNTNENNKRTFILEWEGAGVKDETMHYEKFKTVVGGDKENLFFYSTFFTDKNIKFKFKKGEIYQLSTFGNFVEDTSGDIPGSFENGIIQRVDNEIYEFEKVAPSLLIKELWEKNEQNVDNLDLSEKDLQRKTEEVNRINQKLLGVEKELTSLKSSFSNLKIKEESESKELDKLKEVLEKNKKDIEEKTREISNFSEKITVLNNELNSLQSEKRAVENNRITPERQRKLLQEQERLQNELKNERKRRQISVDKLEEIQSQELSETIQTRLQTKEEELKNLKVSVNNKLATDSQKDALETLLEMNEQRSSLVTLEGVNQTLLLPVERQLKRAKDKLVEKVSAEEIEEFCWVQTEIIKLKIQLEGFQKKEKQFETYTAVPPK